jgi:hypothetical protein
MLRKNMLARGGSKACLLALVLASLPGACEHDPLGGSRDGGSQGGSDGATGAGGSGGAPGVGGSDGATGAGGSGGASVARIGEDGFCGNAPCPDRQQCCFSTGKCVALDRVSADCPAPAATTVICAGQTCPRGQICCLLDGKCIDPSTAGTACPKGGAPSSHGAVACASNADCPATQFCTTADYRLCLGPGTCQSRSNCGSSSGAQFCGCDGVSYPDIQSACRVGVRIAGQGACGIPIDRGGSGAGATGGSTGPRDQVIYCGTSDECPRGQLCCGITSRCYDASIPYLCSFPPAGSSLPCVEDRQCESYEFCSGQGCAGSGGCRSVSTGGCNGELTPVCGCNGKSFTSAGCAAAAAVRVAHDGMCGN